MFDSVELFNTGGLNQCDPLYVLSFIFAKQGQTFIAFFEFFAKTS